jgi:2-dehydro-3-deoxygluconokinase
MIFAGPSWFHWSGITPALSENAAAAVEQACAAARRLGLTVSFDLNYRSKLWTQERAGAVLAPLMPHIDLCVTSVEEIRTVFGIDAPAEPMEREMTAAKRLSERFGIKSVAITMREASSAGESRWAAMLYHKGKFSFSRRCDVTIVDRLGAGDSFTGALIFALRRGDESQKAVDFAIAASALKHTIPGDYNVVSLAEVEALAAGGHGGRVQR